MVHKAFIYIDSADEAGQAAVAQGVEAVIAIYGVRVLARASDDQIKALEQDGFRVEIVDDQDRITVMGREIDTSSVPAGAPPSGISFEIGAAEAEGESGYWLVQFIGPPLPEWIAAVREAGAQVIGPLSSNAILVRMNDAQSGTIAGLDPVQWVGPYLADYKLHPDLSLKPDISAPQSFEPGEAEVSEVPGSQAVMVILFDATALSQVVLAVQSNGGVVEKADGDTIICELPVEKIPLIAAMAQVASIWPYIPPSLAMDTARVVTQVQSTFDLHGLDGEGEVIGVADTGLSNGVDDVNMHNDFWQLTGTDHGRVKGYALGRLAPPMWNDPDGHGTHVAGIAAGNGRASGANRVQTGVAFQAHLIMQSLLDLGGGLGGIPANLNNLFTPVYENDGVRVHNNSWQLHGQYGQYHPRSHHVDQFVWSHPDMVVLFAAGNDATDAAPADGASDYFWLNPFATSRNGIAVGASENNKPAIGFIWTGANFPLAPINGDQVADNDQHLYPGSGRGPSLVTPPVGVPTGDRIKPDLLAPGTCILAPFSAISLGAGATPPYVGGQYISFIGTSMATPHISGMCGLIRQYLRRLHRLSDPNNPNPRRRRPSAALIKALLVHGARPIAGQSAANSGTVPSNHQGWGRVDLRRTLFSHATSDVVRLDNTWLPRRTIFIDNPDYHLNGLPAINPNSRVSHEVRVTVADPSVPLRATLVWTDYPGPVIQSGVLVNQLVLRIIRQSDGTVFNFNLPAGNGPTPPQLAAPLQALNNNIQQIDLSAPNLAAGDYVVRVQANNIASITVDPNDEQDFALVISGAISHSDHRNPGVMSALPDVAFIDLEKAASELSDGLAPSPARPAGNPGSPDIWVSREQNADSARAVNRVEVGQRHYIYVRVRNLGFAEAAGVRVSLYWADPNTPVAFPGDWKTDNIRVDGGLANQRTVTVPARSRNTDALGNIVLKDGVGVAGPFEWEPPRGYARLALLVRAEHPDDPIQNEGDVRWDNNITRRDVLLQDNTTQALGEPSGWDKFVFWLISGFSSPRNIEARLLLDYLDVRDGRIKPLPAGVRVEFWDKDILSDDKLGETTTVATTDALGNPATAVNLTFSTLESGEGGPDLYVRVLKPSGAQFQEFIQNSYFASGSEYWASNSQVEADGGFYREDFSGSNFGATPPRLVIRPAGIHVEARFEYLDTATGEFKPLAAGVTVQVLDSNRSAEQPVLATLTTGPDGQISTLLPKRENYQPSIHFRIQCSASAALLSPVDFFSSEEEWDSQDRQGEVIAPDGTVRLISGHFQNWNQNRLVAVGERLRFRLESPGILLHLRFQYYDRDAWPPTGPVAPGTPGNVTPPTNTAPGTPPPGAFLWLPAGTRVEAREDNAAAQILSVGRVGQEGQVELSVPKGGKAQVNCFVRVVMQLPLSTEPGNAVTPMVEVRKGGNLIQWDTKGHAALDGTSGAFAAVVDRVGAPAAPLLFQIGAAADSGSAGDGTDQHAAPFILRAISEVHNWLRVRTNNHWSGLNNLVINLMTSGVNGSSFNSANHSIDLNTAYTAPAAQQPYTGPARPDHWNRLTIVHHYGHQVFEQIYNDVARGPAPTVPNHRPYLPDREQDRRLALAEGWAEYLASRHSQAVLRPDRSAAQTGWRGQPGNNGADSSGEIVPVALANALWRLDDEIISQGHADIANPVNQRRFQALIWEPLVGLQPNINQQVPYWLYRAIQTANLNPEDLIAPHDMVHIRQAIRRIFEANGMVFTRGMIAAAPVQVTANPRVYRFRVRPVNQAGLHISEMGRITAYRIQAAPTGTFNYVDLEPVLEIPLASPDQQGQLNVNLTDMRRSGIITQAGNHDFRVIARDEFGAWDSFADNFTGNAGAVNNNTKWQLNTLHSMHSSPINVP